MYNNIVFGTRQIGGPPSYNIFSEEKAIELLEYIYNKGIKSFDTAPIYGNGKSEDILGKFINNNIIKYGEKFRENITIISKFGIRIKDNGENYFCFDRDSIIEEIDISLKRLNTNYLDIYLLHIPNGEMNITDILSTLNYLKSIGKIKSYGVCNLYSDSLKDFVNHKDSEIAYVQDFYNILERKAEKLVFPYIKDKNIKFMAYSPLYRGFLTDLGPKELLNKNENAINRLIKHNGFIDLLKKRNLLLEISKRKNISLGKLSIDFLIKNENVDNILFGTTDTKHFDIFIDYFN